MEKNKAPLKPSNRNYTEKHTRHRTISPHAIPNTSLVHFMVIRIFKIQSHGNNQAKSKLYKSMSNDTMKKLPPNLKGQFPFSRSYREKVSAVLIPIWKRTY